MNGDPRRLATSALPRLLVLPGCRLTAVRGPLRGLDRILSGEVVRVGKAEDNDVTLADDTVSRLHCEILRDARGFLLRDLHSTNGTFLDGAEIREAYLHPGALVTVGTVQLRFQPAEERIEVVPVAQEGCGELRGQSEVARLLFALIPALGASDVTVLLEGEAGTGKSLVARTIHERSRRREGPFQTVDCGAPGAILESELFGEESGRVGIFERARGGTLLFDQLDELPLDLQPKLLRVVEQRGVRRQGGTRSHPVDVRLLGSSRRELRREVERGRFRDDLAFRFSTVRLPLPPLRERPEDIALLARHFAGGGEAPLPGGLLEHDWPGNVGELRRVIERGLGFAGDRPASSVGGPGFDGRASYRRHKERWEADFERRYVAWLLQRTDGNISRAAREAEMDRKYLHKLIKKHGLG